MEHTYSQLAAAALYHLTSREMVLSVTGTWPFHSEDKTEKCIKSGFYDIIQNST